MSKGIQEVKIFRWMVPVLNRYLSAIVITCLLIGAQISFGVLESLERTLLAIGSSILAEMVLGRLVYGAWPGGLSAYMTGISVGVLIRSLAYWPYAFCSVFSITSKYVLRWKGRHLWNPSNLGVCVMLSLAPGAVAVLSIQWGNSLWPVGVIWCLGCYAMWRLKHFHICVTYVILFLAFAFVRSLWTETGYLACIAPITGPMYQLFIFFMITDPKTTVSNRRGQCWVVFLVAFVEMILRLNEAIYAPFYALCLVGPVTNAIEVWKKRDESGSG